MAKDTLVDRGGWFRPVYRRASNQILLHSFLSSDWYRSQANNDIDVTVQDSSACSIPPTATAYNMTTAT